MIFLTGDVHHMSMRGLDQIRHAGLGTEVRACRVYLEIANGHGLIPTLFFTGRCALEEDAAIADLLRDFQFELGGHTWDAYKNRWLLAISRRLMGLANGPRFWQRRDMSLTLQIFESRFGRRITAWRNHAYRQDRNTCALARNLGITHVSNLVGSADWQPRRVLPEVWELPINTPPDHESLGHGNLPRQYSIHGWVDQVTAQAEWQAAHGTPTVILAHPWCMWIEDRMAGFRRLCQLLKSHPSAMISAYGGNSGTA